MGLGGSYRSSFWKGAVEASWCPFLSVQLNWFGLLNVDYGEIACVFLSVCSSFPLPHLPFRDMSLLALSGRELEEFTFF